MRFLRYPGGKQRMLSFLSEYLPNSNSIQGTYIEPFVGGGSVFLYVNPKNAILSDLNSELIDLYKGIRNYPHKVWEIYCSFPTGKSAYYQIRDEQIEKKPIYYRAARTLYLNRTCFKGMWRHDKEGKFNVGYGGEERRWAVTHENLVKLSKRFRKATIHNSDFEKIIAVAKKNDFIFLDPPYKPGEKEMYEAHYSNGKFTFNDQVRLSESLKSASDRGVKWLMTNSSHKDITDLYKSFNINKINKGTGSSIGAMTSDSKEVIIYNF
ncbi:DNA adenine methylase [Aeribacillus pallidus]|uniref:DNA adenine methylase n=1 Tax=Aeribacillus pallidus TaxID=33936 RepID=UPI003D21488E